MLSQTSRSYLLLILSSLFSSFFILFYRKASHIASFELIVLLLFSFSLAFSVPLFILQKSWVARIDRKMWFWLFLIAIASTGGNYFNAVAVKYIAPSVSQMIQRTDILFGIAYGVLLFKDQFNSFIAVSLVLSIIGIFFIYNNIFHSNIPTVALFAGIASGFSFASMQLATKFIGQKISPNSINFWRLVFCILVMSVCVYFIPQETTSLSETMLYTACAAFFGPFLNRLLINYAINWVPFSAINIIITLGPILTLFTQYIFFGIVISLPELIGSAFMLSSVLLLTFKYRG